MTLKLEIRVVSSELILRQIDALTHAQFADEVP